MAADMRIERFSVDLFSRLWVICKFESSTLKRPTDYGDNEKTDCTPLMFGAVFCRYKMYVGHYGIHLLRAYDKYSSNGIDFYYFVRNHLEDYCYPHLNIFDKLFMTCAIVAVMCYYCYIYDNDMYKYVGPLCWAMYFETEFKKEFYDAGGWKELEKYAETYDSLVLQFKYMSEIRNVKDIHKLYKIANYYYSFEKVLKRFKQVSKCNENVYCLKCFPMFNVLDFWSTGYVIEDEEFCLITEGYLQIFMRMMSVNKFQALKEKVSNDARQTNFRSDLTAKALATTCLNIKAQIKAMITNELCKRLFVGLNSLNSEKLRQDQVCMRCMFCGGDADQTLEKECNRRVDAVKAEKVKIFIRQTISEEKSTLISEQEACIDKFDELEEKMASRLFMTIGMKSATTKILAKMSEEFGSSNIKDIHGNLNSITTLKSSDESHVKRSKNKKKTKKSKK